MQNCGIKGRTDCKAKVFPANTLTIDFLGNAYYRPFPYKMATHNHVFSVNGDILKNKLVGLYIVAQMSYLRKIYSFNNMGTWPRIKEQEIYLPITKKGNIDFVYIEERVHELEVEHKFELEAYFREAGFEDCALTPKEKKVLQSVEKGNIRNRLFRIDALFNIATGRDIIIGRTRIGRVPLISHQHDDNGISKRIERLANRRLFDYETTLSLADRGVFLATTQAEDFHIGTRVKALTFKDGKHNENIRLFFVAAINKLQILFMDYLTNATDNLPNLQISVPITENGAVNYVFMDTYINAHKKQCIARLKQEIDKEQNASVQGLASQGNKINVIDINKSESQQYNYDDFALLMAAEPFERYKWEGFDQSIRSFFGSNHTILVGCYKGKKYQEWIHSHNMYNIRLGQTKGSMETNRELFESTSLLVLYEFGKPEKLSAYKITGHHEISKEELIKLSYPNKKPRKNYMAFDIVPLEMDLTFLVEHHLIERLIEIDSNNAKGTPIFIEP